MCRNNRALTGFSAFIACILGRWGDAACVRVRFNLLIARLVTARRLLTAHCFVFVACRRLLTVFLGLRRVLFSCFMLLLFFLLLVVVSR